MLITKPNMISAVALVGVRLLEKAIQRPIRNACVVPATASEKVRIIQALWREIFRALIAMNALMIQNTIVAPRNARTVSIKGVAKWLGG